MATTLRICPQCHSQLPTHSEFIHSKILAVIGGTSSGKSHYIATMIKQLRSVIRPNFDVRVRSVGDATRRNYFKYYYRRVYREKLLLDQTQSAGANPVVREPLIYRLEFPCWCFSVPAINLVLFDAAGEDIEDENTIALYNKYILHASGIIFLINPLQIEAVCEYLECPPDGGELIQHTLDRNIELFEKHGLKSKRKIKIPTAFVLSKSDVLEPKEGRPPLVGGDSLLFEDVPHVRKYDLRDFEMVHEEVKALLDDWGEGELLSTAQRFKPHGFFAISALGCNPDKKTLKIPSINPRRCCDPILWLLTQLGYLTKYHS